MSRPSLSARRRSLSASTLPPISENDTLVGVVGSPPPYIEENTHQEWPGKLPFKREPDTAPILQDDDIPKESGWLGRLFSRRGGWIRFLIVFLILLCLVALGIGLGVGLSARKSNASSGNQFNATPEQEEPEKAFPEGTYRFETVLESIRTDCTSDNSTYRCYPYATYSQSPDSSMAVFDWVIEAIDRNANSYQISSTRNPFSILFTNATMNLQGAGTEEERFEFSAPLNVTVFPDRPLDTRNINRKSICYYESVVFSASIYTKKAKSWPPSKEGTKVQNPKRWPYAATMKQSVASAPDVPSCLDPAAAPFGNFSVTAGKECSCVYTNFGL